MKIFISTVLAILVAALVIAPAHAQIIEKKSLNLDGAKKAIAAAVDYAKKNNAPGGVIAVVDEGGNLMALERLDGPFAMGATISIGKARTAVLFKKPRRFFEELINKGRTAMTAVDGFTPLIGGIPIIIDGEVVGGIATASRRADSTTSQNSKRRNHQTVKTSLLYLGALSAFAVFATAAEVVNIDKNGLALQGYDPVAYFTDGKPVKGSAEFTATYKGAKYQFASAEHKQLFEKSPAKYEPQFGGFCGYAASIDKLAPIEVEYFQVLHDRLILQHNKKAWGPLAQGRRR